MTQVQKRGMARRAKRNSSKRDRQFLKKLLVKEQEQELIKLYVEYAEYDYLIFN